MQRIISFTLAQRVLFNLLFVLLMAIGVFVMFKSPVERYPNIDFGKAYINTYYPGASPRDVETLITREIEDAIENLENLDFILSRHKNAQSNRYANDCVQLLPTQLQRIGLQFLAFNLFNSLPAGTVGFQSGVHRMIISGLVIDFQPP